MGVLATNTNVKTDRAGSPANRRRLLSRRTIGCIVAAGVIACAAIHWRSTRESRRYRAILNEGRDLIQSGRIDDPVTIRNWAVALAKAGDYQPNERPGATIGANCPSDAARIAAALRANKKVDEASDAAARAVELAQQKPHSPIALAEVAVILANGDLPEQAKQAATIAITTSQSSRELAEIGSMLARGKLKLEGAEAVRKAIALDAEFLKRAADPEVIRKAVAEQQKVNEAWDGYAGIKVTRPMTTTSPTSQSGFPATLEEAKEFLEFVEHRYDFIFPRGRSEAIKLSRIAEVYASIGKVKEATDWAEKAVHVAQKITRDDDRGKEQIVGRWGSAHENARVGRVGKWWAYEFVDSPMNPTVAAASGTLPDNCMDSVEGEPGFCSGKIGTLVDVANLLARAGLPDAAERAAKEAVREVAEEDVESKIVDRCAVLSAIAYQLDVRLNTVSLEAADAAEHWADEVKRLTANAKVRELTSRFSIGQVESADGRLYTYDVDTIQSARPCARALRARLYIRGVVSRPGTGPISDEEVQRSLKAAEETGDGVMVAHALAANALLMARGGRAYRARELAEKAVSKVEGMPDEEWSEELVVAYAEACAANVLSGQPAGSSSAKHRTVELAENSRVHVSAFRRADALLESAGIFADANMTDAAAAAILAATSVAADEQGGSYIARGAAMLAQLHRFDDAMELVRKMPSNHYRLRAVTEILNEYVGVHRKSADR